MPPTVADPVTSRGELPPGVDLDPGATVNAWAADVAAQRIAQKQRSRVFVNLDGDVAVASCVDANTSATAVLLVTRHRHGASYVICVPARWSWMPDVNPNGETLRSNMRRGWAAQPRTYRVDDSTRWFGKRGGTRLEPISDANCSSVWENDDTFDV